MASVKIWNINQRMGKRIKYICQDSKTENGRYISAVNCSNEPEACIAQMKSTKRRYHKENGVLLYHAVQSFKPGEVTPEQAHKISLDYAERVWGENFEVLVTTHTDRSHIHSHFLLNSVSFTDGKKYHDGGKKNLEYLRSVSDELCIENGLPIIEDPKPSQNKTYNIQQMEKEGKKTVRSFIREDIDEAIRYARNLPDFISILKRMDYEVSTEGKYLKVRPYGKERFFRLYKLGKEYSEEEIIRRIQERKNPLMKAVVIPKKSSYRRQQKSRIALIAYSKRRSFVSDILRTYLHYRNILGRVQKQRYPGRPPAYLREDLQQLKKYSDETVLLARNNIRSPEQLETFQENLKAKMKSLNDRRQEMRKKLRTATDEGEITVLKHDAEYLSGQIKVVFREQKQCESIKKRHEDFQRKINHTVKRLEQPQRTLHKNESEEEISI